MIHNMNNNFEGNSCMTGYGPYRIFCNMCLKYLTDWSKNSSIISTAVIKQLLLKPNGNQVEHSDR